MRTVWVCEVCNKEFETKEAAEQHEQGTHAAAPDRLGRRLYALLRMKFGYPLPFDGLNSTGQQFYKDIASMFWGEFVAEHAQALAEFEARRLENAAYLKQTEALRSITKIIKGLGQ